MSEYYVYSYLRKDGSPYYIGKGKDDRIHSKNHSVNLPDLNRRKILFEKMSEKEAYAAEYMLIKVFGLKTQTGILRNQIDSYGFGGDTSKSENYIKAKNQNKFGFKGKLNPRAKICDIFCETTGKLLEESTIMKKYAIENNIPYSHLTIAAKKQVPYKGIIVKFRKENNGK